MIAQFKQCLYNKNFSLQDQDKRVDSLQKRTNFWLNYVAVHEGAPIPDNHYVYDYKDKGLAYVFREAKNNPELRDLKEILAVNDSENH